MMIAGGVRTLGMEDAPARLLLSEKARPAASSVRPSEVPSPLSQPDVDGALGICTIGSPRIAGLQNV